MTDCRECRAELDHRGGGDQSCDEWVFEGITHLRPKILWKSLCLIRSQRDPRWRWGGKVPTKCP